MNSFRRKHPILTGIFVLGGIFFLFLAGVSLLFTSLFQRPDRSTELFSSKEGIGVVELKGFIMAPEKVISSLTDFRRNRGIKAIILRIDCPGGAVGASQEIYDEVKRTSAVKPVVASMSSMGASGAYYAALGASEIMANPGTLTGSMGVIVKFANLQKLFDKIGYESEVVKSGPLKDIGAPGRPLSGEERALMQRVIDNVHGQFMTAVAESRSLPAEKVRELADGRIFTGQQAMEEGLIDRLGNFTDAVLLAAELGGMDTEAPRLVYAEQERFSLMNLLNGGGARGWFNGLVRETPLLAYALPGF